MSEQGEYTPGENSQRDGATGRAAAACATLALSGYSLHTSPLFLVYIFSVARVRSENDASPLLHTHVPRETGAGQPPFLRCTRKGTSGCVPPFPPPFRWRADERMPTSVHSKKIKVNSTGLGLVGTGVRSSIICSTTLRLPFF